MPKQKFTINRDIRIDGQHVESGSTVNLDPQDPADSKTLRDLLASTCVVEADLAQKLLAQPVEAESNDIVVTPPAKAKPTAPAAPTAPPSAPAA